MERVHYYKMNGLGNDFVIFDQRGRNEIELILKGVEEICDRDKGIGCDQMIILTDSEVADVKMLIFNKDGSSSGACGNASRCVAKLLRLKEGAIEVGQRILKCYEEKRIYWVNMGPCEIGEGINYEGYTFTAADIGNPHLVTFDDVSNKRAIGEALQNVVPGGVNVNFAKVIDTKQIMLRVFERGVGFTQACGSGACATFAVAHQAMLVDSAITVKLPGGELMLRYDDGDIWHGGAAELSYEAKIVLS